MKSSPRRSAAQIRQHEDPLVALDLATASMEAIDTLAAGDPAQLEAGEPFQLDAPGGFGMNLVKGAILSGAVPVTGKQPAEAEEDEPSTS